MSTQMFCHNCGGPLAADVRFCPSCGAAVAGFAAAPAEPPAPVHQPLPVSPPPPAPSVSPSPVPKRRADRTGLLFVAFGLLFLVAALTFFVLRPRGQSAYEVNSAAEQAYPQPTERTGREKTPEPIIEAPATRPVDAIDVIEEPYPPTMTVPSTTPAEPVISITPSAPAAAPEISERDAVARVSSFVAARDYYDIPSSCFETRSLGYENVGFTIEVVGTCADIGNAGRILGRWRVDARTNDVYVQKSDGRYLSP
jgi:hypothetical protein